MFVQKSNDEGSDFYYLGEVEAIDGTIEQLEKTVENNKKLNVVQMNLNFKQPIETKLHKYLKVDN